MLGLYDRAAFSTDAGHKILSRFVYNGEQDFLGAGCGAVHI